MSKTVLTLATQKSGRLSEKTRELLKEAGISIVNGSKSRLKAYSDNFPLTVLHLRDDDIPQHVADGIADAGIVGENVFIEKDAAVELTERLGFSRCRMSLAVPRHFEYQGIQDLDGRNIATSYPGILKAYLQDAGIEASVHFISGSVEVAPSVGLADAIFDIVSTGSTLMSNGLKEVEVVMQSEAVLVTNTSLSAEKTAILDDLLFRIRAVRKAQSYKYILLNAPNDAIGRITEILPGMKSPTVLPLAASGWSSVHSVIRESDFWERIENLKAAGAQGILVVPIEKMIL